jgi:predicted transcriptional regulator
MASSKLLDKTLDLVRTRPRDVTYDQIATETEVSVSWLKKLVNGEIEHPSVCYVEAVYVYLNKKSLDV